jgi:thiosulfate dehydrogenase
LSDGDITWGSMRMFTLGFLSGVLVGPLLATLIAISGFWPISATARPPAWETKMARHTLNASISRQAPQLRNPMAASDETLHAGLRMYRDGCAGCHGDYQKPSHWGTTAFYPGVPQFGSEPPDKPDWQMFWIVQNGIRYSGMGAWGGEVTDERIWQVVTFLANLRTLPPDVQADWQHPK